MKKETKFYAKTLEQIKYKVPNVRIGAGVEIALHATSEPILQALRLKLLESPKSMLITEKGKQFLFSEKEKKNKTPRDDSFWRP